MWGGTSFHAGSRLWEDVPSLVRGTGEGARGRLALRVVLTQRLLIRVDGVCARRRDRHAIVMTTFLAPRRARVASRPNLSNAGAKRRTRSGNWRCRGARRTPSFC